jgi:hypothetical protein
MTEAATQLLGNMQLLEEQLGQLVTLVRWLLVIDLIMSIAVLLIVVMGFITLVSVRRLLTSKAFWAEVINAAITAREEMIRLEQERLEAEEASNHAAVPQAQASAR